MTTRRPKTGIDPSATIGGTEAVAAPFPLRRQLEILDEHSEQAFDRILALVSDIFDTAKCGILINEGDRFWAKTHGGKLALVPVSSESSFA